MRRPFIAAAALGLMGVASGACSGAGGEANAGGGRVVVERVARGSTRLLDDPGRATFCPDDSLLVVVAVGRKWTGGIAMRVALPLGQPRTFTVQPALGDAGTASAVFRPLEAGAAQYASAGSVRLEGRGPVSGTFDLTAPDSAGIHVAFRGRWSQVPLRLLPKGQCTSR